MKRRDLFKQTLTAGAKLLDGITAAEKKRVLRIAHITDVCLRPEYNAPERFRKCLEDIKKNGVSLILNGGNTIWKANDSPVISEKVKEMWNIQRMFGGNTWKAGDDPANREKVKPMWDIWKKTTTDIFEKDDLNVYNCLGNDDLWWPEGYVDDSYAQSYAMKQLETGKVKMEKRFYSFNRENWHFIVLDSTKKFFYDERGKWMSEDYEQKEWLKNDLASLAPGTPVICMSNIPVISVSKFIVGGSTHPDAAYFKNLFYKHRNKKIYCISGYRHLVETGLLYGVKYFCNGSMSGYYWENGDKGSAAKGYYRETPPGYAILDLYDDGTLVNEYIPHGH